MAEYRFPGSVYDNPELLLSCLGSYWSNSYAGSDLVQATAYARAQLDAQAHLNLLELIASISRFNIPVFHTENWYFLIFKESEINNAAAVLPVYDNVTDYTYQADAQLQYGVPPQVSGYSIKVPNELHNVKIILNRITDSSLTLSQGIDFWFSAPGVITFRENPFNNPLVPIQEIFEGNTVVDRQAGLWLFRGEWDWNNVYEQFGYALGLQLKSSEGYKALMVALLDGLVCGSNNTNIEQCWSAITGIPLTIEDGEVVEVITADAYNALVITDKQVYKFTVGSEVIVQVGQVLQAGDPLVNTLQFYEFNRGQLSADLSALVLGPGILASGYLSDLVFANETVPLIVESDEAGRTKVSFEISGFPLDVSAFWDEVHARGISSGKTLANYLDVRPEPVGEPTAASLPATINPLQFLTQNLLRYHAFAVKIRQKYLGDLKLGLVNATILRKIIPPHVVMLVLVELEHTDEMVIMDGPGTPERPGYTERVSGFPFMTISDLVSPNLVTERVTVKQLTGKCE